MNNKVMREIKMEISDFGQCYQNDYSKRIHIICLPKIYIAICDVFLYRINISVNTVKWKNICPNCKKIYGKKLKQDLIVFKLRGTNGI